MKTLLKGGTVVTFDPRNPIIEDGFVSIDEEGTISRVAGGPPVEEAERTIDVDGKLIIPGLINAHMHAYSTFARGMAVPGPAPVNFLDVLESLWWKLDRALTPEDCYYSALVPAIEAVKRGTTTWIDHHASPSSVPNSLSEVQGGLEKVGLRGVLCYEISDRDGKDVRDQGLEENIRALREFDSSRYSSLVGLHASFTIGKETLEQVSEIVNQHDTGVHVHVAEGRNDEPDSENQYNQRIVERFYDAGLLGPNSLLAHCIHINDDEIKLLAETDTNVVHNPTSNMNNAVGAAPILDLLENDICVGLGTDGMSADPWTDLRSVSHLQNHEHENPSTSFAEGVQMLTKNNPQIASRLLGTPIGQIREGSAGDVVVLDYRPATPMNPDNLAGHMLFGWHEDQVTHTVVGGDVVYDDGEVPHIDEEKLARESRAQAKELWKRVEKIE